MVRLTIYLSIIQEENLIDAANKTGEYLHNQLLVLQDDYADFVSNARGAGLMCAFDLPNTETRDKLLDQIIQNGTLILGSGDNAIRFRPPLNISTDEIDYGIDIIRKSLDKIIN